MTTLHSERATVQNPLLHYATEAGWTYLAPEDALRLRRGEASPILWDVFIQQAQKLNADVVAHRVKDSTPGGLRACRRASKATLKPGNASRDSTVFRRPRTLRTQGVPARWC